MIKFSLSFSLLFLLAIPSVVAHGNEDGMGSGHMDSNINSDTMMYMNNDGFESYTDHMKINGEIQINDSVKLIISAQPSEEMNVMMNDHMGSDSEVMMYSNMMTISMTKLVNSPN